MENEICNFTILQNPSRKYANTVNIVFFRAIPLTKNFQKYVNGLKDWKGLMKKYYPESQLQIFVDKSIVSDPDVQKILVNLEARVYLFECPEYLRKDQFHIGLFGTMIRFYPFFDINTKPMRIAHIQELEPGKESLPTFEDMNKASLMNFKHNVGIIYYSPNSFEIPPGYDEQHMFESGTPYPWMYAGRFVAMTKIPFFIWSDYVKDIQSGKQFYNKYAAAQHVKTVIKEHENFSFGVDESFLNEVYLKWLIKNNYAIGIILDYKISYPVFYLVDKLKRDKRTLPFLNYILQKNHTSLNKAIDDFDDLFYVHEQSKKARESAPRFYQLVERYPDWLGIGQSTFVKKVFDGYLSRKCVIVIQNNKIVDIRDL